MRVLRPYQRKALYFTLDKAYNALFLDMRLGKTLITIRSIRSKLFDRVQSVLIVCPYSAFPAWHNELLNEGYKEEEITFLIGTKAKRRKIFEIAKARCLDNTVKWFIINVEGWRALQEITLKKWQVMIIDESYCLQSPPHISKKTKVMCTSKFFTTYFREVPLKYILTGTPAPESELNYFMQLFFLDKGILQEENYWKFRSRYFIQYEKNQWAISEKGKAYLARRLSTCAYFLSRKDVNLGGEKIYERRLIQVDKVTRKIYNDIWTNFVVKVGDEIRDVTDIGGVRFIWARRLLGGFVTLQDIRIQNQEAYTFEFIFSGKIDELKSLLSGELKGQQVVVWAEFTNEINLIFEKIYLDYKTCIIDGSVSQDDRNCIENRFRSGHIQILICQPQATQYSRDFSTADTEIFYSTPVSLKTRIQAEDRLISTKTNSTLVIDFTCESTIEEDIVESLKKKESKQAMIKRIVQRLMGVKYETE